VQMKTRCLIIDDEPLAQRVIESHMEKLDDLELVAKCSNALEAMNLLKKEKVDLLFLDIQMPELSGVEFLKSLQSPPSVIFTTAYRNYAIDAFELDVLDYLLKPITFERFVKSVNKYYEKISNHAPKVFETKNDEGDDLSFIYVREKKTMIKVLLKDILYIESLKDYIRIFLNTGKSLMTKQKISSMIDLLPEKKFIRVHKSYIVNIEKIKTLSPTSIGINDKIIPIGRSYKAYTLSQLGYDQSI
jgi:DNA-binding LytR/AlgR family response regulator